MASKLRGSKREPAKQRGERLPEFPEIRETKVRPQAFKAANKAQERYVNMMQNNIVTFGVGPAGTGKSFCAAYVAAEKFKNGEIDRIVITRPVVEAGEQLGHLPGELEDKFAPYVAPILDCLSRMLGKSHVEALLENGKIEMLPLAYMRGHTFNNSFVILDEAQNVTRKQMLLFLSRIGKNSTVVIDGDMDQKDLPVDGLDDAVRRLDRVSSVGVMKFTHSDIVRSGIVKDILQAYSKSETNDEEVTEDTAGLETYLSR